MLWAPGRPDKLQDFSILEVNLPFIKLSYRYLGLREFTTLLLDVRVNIAYPTDG
jgi:hypothetical protein